MLKRISFLRGKYILSSSSIHTLSVFCVNYRVVPSTFPTTIPTEFRVSHRNIPRYFVLYRVISHTCTFVFFLFYTQTLVITWKFKHKHTQILDVLHVLLCKYKIMSNYAHKTQLNTNINITITITITKIIIQFNYNYYSTLLD